MISPAQCRMARAAVKLSRTELSRLAQVAPSTLADFEAGRRTPYDRTVRDIMFALESKGVEFIPSDNGGPGVRLRSGSMPDEIR